MSVTRTLKGGIRRALDFGLARVGKQVARIPADPFTDMGRLLDGVPIRHVVDGGAYHGEVATRLAKCFPSARVHAFEPQADSAEVLRALAKDNERLSVHELALSDVSGSTLFYRNAQGYTGSLLQPSAWSRSNFREETEPQESYPVKVVRLDDWVRDQQLTGVDVLKLDLQGNELRALDGGAELLRGSVRLVYTEIEFVPLYDGACLFYEVAARLAESGFRLFHLYHVGQGRAVTPEGQLLYADAIFTHPERLRGTSD